MLPQMIQDAMKGITYAPAFPIDAAKLYEPMVVKSAAIGGIYAHSFFDINKEWINFISRRTQEDITLPSRLMACRNPGDAMKTATEFMQKAFSDYQSEWARLSEIGSAAAAHAMETMSSSSRQCEGKACCGDSKKSLPV